MSVTSVCAYGSVTMYEMSWIGEPKVRTVTYTYISRKETRLE